jgi:hypothetical protein
MSTGVIKAQGGVPHASYVATSWPAMVRRPSVRHRQRLAIGRIPGWKYQSRIVHKYKLIKRYHNKSCPNDLVEGGGSSCRV